MEGFKTLVERLRGVEGVEISHGRPYVATDDDGRAVRLNTKAIVQVVSAFPPNEYLDLAYFGEKTPSYISYGGDDMESMIRTLGQLGIPKRWPRENLGWQFFFGVREKLNEAALQGINEQPVIIEAKVSPDKLHQMHAVFKRLSEIYYGNINRIRNTNRIR